MRKFSHRKKNNAFLLSCHRLLLLSVYTFLRCWNIATFNVLLVNNFPHHFFLQPHRMSHINIRCVRIASRLAFFRHRPAINESRGLISHAGRIAGLASMRKAMRVCLRCGNKEIGSGSRKKKSERYFVILEFLFILWHSQKKRDMKERRYIVIYQTTERHNMIFDCLSRVHCLLFPLSL